MWYTIYNKMDLDDSSRITNGLPNGVYIGQQDRTDELNHRILERTVPNEALAPNFSPRPVLSRYARFPMLDARMPAETPIKPNYDYSGETNFTPPVQRIAPVSGFINNVHTETILRGQERILEKNDDKTTYIPSSDSDLYKTYVTSTPSVQPYPDLFVTPTFSQELHPNVRNQPNLSNGTFHNFTRTQLRVIDTPSR